MPGYAKFPQRIRRVTRVYVRGNFKIRFPIQAEAKDKVRLLVMRNLQEKYTPTMDRIKVVWFGKLLEEITLISVKIKKSSKTT